MPTLSIDYSSFVPLPHYKSTLIYGDNVVVSIGEFDKIEILSKESIITYWVQFDKENAALLSGLFNENHEVIHVRPAKMKIHHTLPLFSCIVSSSRTVLRQHAHSYQRETFRHIYGDTQIRVNLKVQDKLDDMLKDMSVGSYEEKEVAVRELTKFDILDV